MKRSVALRTKLLIVFIVLAVLPSLLITIFGYVSGSSAVESNLRAQTQRRTNRIVRTVDEVLAAHERRLLELASEQSLTDYVRNSSSTTASTSSEIPMTVRAHFEGFFRNSRGHFERAVCVNAEPKPLFIISNPGARDAAPQFQTSDFVSTSARVDERVWQSTPREPLRSPITQEQYGTSLRTTVPIFASDGVRAIGALVLEIKLKDVFEEAAVIEDLNGASANGAAVVAIDNSNSRIVYHTNEALKYQPVAAVMPYFEAVAVSMRQTPSGTTFYKNAEGESYLATFGQLRGLNLSVAVAENYSAGVAPIWRWSLAAIAISLLAGSVGVAVILLIAARTRKRIERVAEGVAAVAGGDLNQRLEVDTDEDTRRLADGFNQMSDRLRELIRREAESRQFESFLRLSAMLTHDLKNAITGLSMLVSNMERHLHREEFREDAIHSLREATDKLKRIVSRLTEPVKSLSGEYRRDARQTDLVPIIRRVLATNAESSSPLYEVKTQLPEKLVAVAEADRIENVIENLVINALEAMGAAGGRLTVEAGSEGDNRVFFSVADTGPGMDEEFIKLRLFRPFSTTKQKGIGLGLFTCREIVEAHGGRLDVESKPGTGTRFRVVLPSRLFAPGEQSQRSSEGVLVD